MKVLSRIVALLLIPGLVNAATAAHIPFRASLPKGFSGPEINSRGTTTLYAYSRRSADTGINAVFQVGVITMPPEGGKKSLEFLLTEMLKGIERRRTDFKKSGYRKSKLGSLEARTVDWEGKAEGFVLKGRMICAVSEDRLICLQFQDSAKSWDQSLLEAVKTIETFDLVK